MKGFGARLINLRATKTQQQVANDLNISVSAWGMYEREERIPRDEIKIKIAKYFKTSVESIFYA